MRDDKVEVERIKARLQELEASRQTQGKDSKATCLAEMNKRNRVQNFKNASEKKPVNTSLKAGEAVYDPFSRWTRSRNYYLSNSGGASGAAAAGETNGDAIAVLEELKFRLRLEWRLQPQPWKQQLMPGSLWIQELQSTKGLKQTYYIILNCPFHWPCFRSLAVLKEPQAGFMARKQRMEATVGCKVPENDGRHALTLTVSDHKRRRGLL
ncbi:unnamed protein product [Fraxinus pennsylvanica]|uniref:Uncharacterized protein n=1 Tax=Fraxinus pennsylvanica TaxID=56036 RepID=A0AAD1YRE1_9LAMI|nr:unnamed protein product [Fraxinus pennsylvanica]